MNCGVAARRHGDVRYPGLGHDDAVLHDLYDMDADPDQLENLFGTQPALEKELHDELLAYWSCQGADCP